MHGYGSPSGGRKFDMAPVEVASPEKPVLLDDETTWPDMLRKAFDVLLPRLRRYEEMRSEYDERGERDIGFRFRRPLNPDQSAKDESVATANGVMSNRDVVGFHCSRLHVDDVADIRANGLRLLMSSHMRQRIDQREAAGDIPSAVAESLRSGIARSLHATAGACREGMSWFVYTRPVLSDESAVVRLFKFWGGEALYGLYEDDPIVAPLLRSIGKASIVVARVSAIDAARHGDVGECMRRGFLERRGVALDNRSSLEGAVRRAVGAQRILDIYQIGDSQFEALTSSHKWETRLHSAHGAASQVADSH